MRVSISLPRIDRVTISPGFSPAARAMASSSMTSGGPA